MPCLQQRIQRTSNQAEKVEVRVTFSVAPGGEGEPARRRKEGHKDLLGGPVLEQVSLPLEMGTRLGIAR